MADHTSGDCPRCRGPLGLDGTCSAPRCRPPLSPLAGAPPNPLALSHLDTVVREPAPKHVLYIDCDGVPLKLEPALQAQTPTIDFSISDGHLSLSVMVPLTEEAAKFAGQLAEALAHNRPKKGGSRG